MDPIVTLLSPATRNKILGILQGEQDYAMSLLSLSPLFSGLFVSYADRVAALESASATISPESEERKIFQATIAALQKENEKVKSEAAEASQEALRSQVSYLKEVNMTQQDSIKSLRAELVEARDRHDRLMVDSNAEMAALQIRALDLEVNLEPYRVRIEHNY